MVVVDDRRTIDGGGKVRFLSLGAQLLVVVRFPRSCEVSGLRCGEAEAPADKV